MFSCQLTHHHLCFRATFVVVLKGASTCSPPWFATLVVVLKEVSTCFTTLEVVLRKVFTCFTTLNLEKKIPAVLELAEPNVMLTFQSQFILYYTLFSDAAAEVSTVQINAPHFF